jgi:hypothetical protein
MSSLSGYLFCFLILSSVAVFAKAPKDKPLTTAQISEVDDWVGKKVKKGEMTKKQGDDSMKHPEALYKVMQSEKKPKKGDKHGN